jgi:hypothetical protein
LKKDQLLYRLNCRTLRSGHKHQDHLVSPSTMAASIARLGAKRLCLRPVALPKASSPRAASASGTISSRPFYAAAARRYATTEAYPGTKLVPTDEHFSHPTNPRDPAYSPDEGIDPEDVNKRSIRHYTVNFGPQHPAAHGVLRLILVRAIWKGKFAQYTIRSRLLT